MDSKLFQNLTDYMIVYPIKWYTFIKRILHRSTRYKNIIVINKNIIGNDLNIINDVKEIFQMQNDLVDEQENKDFIIWYFKKTKTINFLDLWFRILVLRLISELYNEFIYSSITGNSFFIQLEDIRLIIKNERIYIQNLKQSKVISVTYNYNYFLLKKQLSKILIAFFC